MALARGFVDNAPMMRWVGLGLTALLSFQVSACDDGGSDGSVDAAVPAGDAGVAEAATPDGGDGGGGLCRPEVKVHTVLASPHISADAFAPSAYNSNPPSSGPHCSAWGDYGTYAQRPLPRCNYIHNLEHGAVVLLHKCAAACPEITAALAKVARDFTGDTKCTAPRFVLTPDADLEHAVAAAAWGATFTAACLDAEATAALSNFVRAHYNKAPEDVCAGGGIAAR